MSKARSPQGHFSGIVEERIKEWTLQSEQKESSEYRPLITISKEFALEGALIAKKISKKLNMSFWDKDLVHHVAENSGLRESIIASLDKKAQSSLEDITNSLVLGENATNRGYIHNLYKVFRTIEKHGGSVVVGRGSQFVLRRKALKIRLISSITSRAKYVSETKKITEKEALIFIEQKDNERKSFYAENYRKDAHDPHHYDLVLNLEDLSPEATEDLITQAYKTKFGRSK